MTNVNTFLWAAGVVGLYYVSTFFPSSKQSVSQSPQKPSQKLMPTRKEGPSPEAEFLMELLIEKIKQICYTAFIEKIQKSVVLSDHQHLLPSQKDLNDKLHKIAVKEANDIAPSLDARDNKTILFGTPECSLEWAHDHQSGPSLIAKLFFEIIPGYLEKNAVICPIIRPIRCKVEMGINLKGTAEKLIVMIKETNPVLNTISAISSTLRSYILTNEETVNLWDRPISQVSTASQKVTDYCASVFNKAFKQLEKQPADATPNKETLKSIAEQLQLFRWEILNAFKRNDSALTDSGLTLHLNWRHSSGKEEHSSITLIQTLFFNISARPDEDGKNHVLCCEAVKHNIELIEVLNKQHKFAPLVISEDEINKAYLNRNQ